MISWEVAGSIAARSLTGSINSLLVLQALCTSLFCSCALKIILPLIFPFYIPLLCCFFKCPLRISSAPKAPKLLFPFFSRYPATCPCLHNTIPWAALTPRFPAWFLNQIALVIALWIGFLSSNIFKPFFFSLLKLSEGTRRELSHQLMQKERWNAAWETKKRNACLFIIHPKIQYGFGNCSWFYDPSVNSWICKMFPSLDHIPVKALPASIANVTLWGFFSLFSHCKQSYK